MNFDWTEGDRDADESAANLVQSSHQLLPSSSDDTARYWKFWTEQVEDDYQKPQFVKPTDILVAGHFADKEILQAQNNQIPQHSFRKPEHILSDEATWERNPFLETPSVEDIHSLFISELLRSSDVHSDNCELPTGTQETEIHPEQQNHDENTFRWNCEECRDPKTFCSCPGPVASGEVSGHDSDYHPPSRPAKSRRSQRVKLPKKYKRTK